MPRNIENRSISFDSDLFQAMEYYRGKHLLARSEFVQRAVEKYLQEGRKETSSEVTSIRKAVPYARKRKK